LVEQTVSRPTKYTPEHADRARFLAETFGATDAQVARALGVSERTLASWKNEHREFLQALQEGKDAYDQNVVGSAMLLAAKGFHYQDEKWDGDHVNDDGSKGCIVRLWHFARPDPRAAAVWLANRHRARPGLPAGPPVVGNDLPPGTDELPCSADLQAAARRLLEEQHGTRLLIPSREVPPPATGSPSDPEPTQEPAEPEKGTQDGQDD
jgi:hypothetical protein